ncbi:AfsR/SARP family transcriptional regulator [Amycolatopsis sp. RTGN1]|uniref:AfsR/SARP family transcriptional regulator n=1 Tax=Amycolatopsis ponsaeliensis TaxID=2992142 RepID=UPI00254E417C|nr:AfsR/SARP family transcriptional regulator [Amycolatopsis sp. RTGN1]
MTLGSPQQRAILALLMAKLGHPVSMAKIVEVIWCADPPPSAANVIHRHIGAIRRLLEPLLPERAAGRWLSRSANGYQLDARAEAVDLHRFRDLVCHARSAGAAGRWSQAGERYREALALWTGPVATGCPRHVTEHAVFVAVEMEYLQALREAVDVLVDTALPEEVVTALREASGRYPLDESLLARLVLALGVTGRQGEAFTAYETARRCLADEFGVGPGPELRAAHGRVLRQAARTWGLVAAPAVAPVPIVRPAQLPMDVPYFAGRRGELALLLAADERPGAPVPRVRTITGVAGVGKTTLATHAAHRLAPRFPDGQLYANLRGSDPSAGAAATAVVLHGFLEALGVPQTRVPGTVDGASALLRSLLANQRVLVVLDDARDAAQVRSLLPGSPGCLTVVTSRQALHELAVAEGTCALPLRALTPAESRELLARRVGESRLAAEGAALDDVVEFCQGFPLTLALVAGLATLRSHLPMSAIVERLRATRGAAEVVVTLGPGRATRCGPAGRSRRVARP